MSEYNLLLLKKYLDLCEEFGLIEDSQDRINIYELLFVYYTKMSDDNKVTQSIQKIINDLY